MHNEGNGIYSIEIPAGTEVFQSDIIVTAYDKIWKNKFLIDSITLRKVNRNQEKAFRK